jgi:hypothetical protein
MSDTASIPARLAPAPTPFAPAGANAPLEFVGILEARHAAADDPRKLLADWVRDYLSQPHPELGRSGHVCPFTAQAARLDTIRIGLDGSDGSDATAILKTMDQALAAFDAIPCTKAGRQFRTVIVGFPARGDAQGEAALKHVQRAMRHHSTRRGKMIGLFGPDSQHKGLLNPAFRSQRCPVPALAIRMLVEKDAPFVARNPRLLPIYLATFPVDGFKRLAKLLYARLRPSS